MRSIFLAGIFLSLSVALTFSQQIQKAESIAQNLDERHAKYPLEKVYVHTDRDIYSHSQTLWFKGYVVNATTHRPIALSKVLYVDLLFNDRVITSIKSFIDEGFSTGNMMLSDTLGAGNYVLRAYTKYMLNYSNDFLFTKSIKVVDPIDQYDPENIAKGGSDEFESMGTIDLRFFPEGGYLVAGELSVIGFKAVGLNGLGIEVAGSIYNSRDEPVSEFQSNSIGIGKTVLVPEISETYYARINAPALQNKIPLPPVKAEGFVLKTRVWNGTITVQANHNKMIPLDGYSILVHSRGLSQAYFVGTSNSTILAARINMTDIPPGVLSITLFDPYGQAICERLVFNDESSQESLVSLSTNRDSYRLRDKVEIQTEVAEIDSAQISIAVVRPEYLGTKGSVPTIQSYLLLQSDLNGYVQDGDRYFDPTNKYRSEDMDALMLTQGWRRFSWDDIILNKYPYISFNPEVGFNIVGNLTNYYNEKKPVIGTVSITFLENLLFKEETTTDEDGYFAFNQLQFIDTVQVVLQAKKQDSRKKGKEDPIKINLLEEPSLEIKTPKAFPIPMSESTAFEESVRMQTKIDSVYQNDLETLLLEDVTISATRDSWKDSPFNRGQLYRNPRSRLSLDSIQIGNMFSIVDLFRRLPGVQVGGVFPDYLIRIRNATSITLDVTPLFLVDNIPTDLQFLVGMDASTVEFIDLLTTSQGTMYGEQGYGGIIAIFTRQGTAPGGNAQQAKLNWGVNSFPLIGFQKAHEYYAPRYDVKKEEHIRPDYRSVLHWEPTVVIRNGEATSFDFYTSDEKAEYDIVVQGLSYDGNPVFIVKRITVGLNN